MSYYPEHVQNFFDNLEQVNELMKIHQKIAGISKGRKSGVSTLNKSGIVLLTACWETYIEELLASSFDFMLANATEYKSIPYSVLTKASNDLKNHKDARKVWELAGDGWKTVLINYKSQIISKELDYFHVPRPENVDDLFEKLLGITNVSANWKWKSMSNLNAKKTLNNFIDLRGEIAHKVKSSKTVLKKDVQYYRDFINCCGVILHNVANEYLKKQLGKEPWSKFYYGTIG